MTRSLVRLLVFSAALGFAAAASAQALDPGEVLVGAAKVNIYPRPIAALGQVWEHNEANCELNPDDAGAQVLFNGLFGADTRLPWPENPHCLYRGGFGIGPMNSLTSFDPQYGL